ncbi:MAG: hypothetical protein MUO50_05295, partial [Longimicrobiales bacterium]|nr:hypothetical protein [Longimicrobiales bacterium]
IPGLPPLGTVSNVEPSRYDAGTAYISVDFHQVNNTDPFAYKTTDYGKSWTLISGDIPKSVFSYVHVIREDPVRPGLLYIGTENSLLVSFNDGGDWVPLQTNLPQAPVYWLTIQEHFNDLVVATYGRGFWILDDITPLQQLSSEVLSSGGHLFEPRPAYRFRNREGRVSQPEDPAEGENPEFGASIHYYLGEDSEGDGSLDVLDSTGRVVNSLRDVPDAPGLHRVFWDLRYESSRTPRMRTKVLEHSHVPLGEDGWRPAGDGGRVSPLAPPGEYTLRLRVGDQEFSAPLVVLKDPVSTGSVADIRAQFDVILQLREETNAVVDLINEAEVIRAQIVDLKELLRGKEGADELLVAEEALDEALVDLEMGLTDLRLSGGSAGQDALRWPRQLYARITSLAGYIGGSDFPPTMQEIEVYEGLQELLRAAENRMVEIRGGELAALNRMLVEKGIPHVSGGRLE